MMDIVALRMEGYYLIDNPKIPATSRKRASTDKRTLQWKDKDREEEKRRGRIRAS